MTSPSQQPFSSEIVSEWLFNTAEAEFTSQAWCTDVLKRKTSSDDECVTDLEKKPKLKPTHEADALDLFISSEATFEEQQSFLLPLEASLQSLAVGSVTPPRLSWAEEDPFFEPLQHSLALHDPASACNDSHFYDTPPSEIPEITDPSLLNRQGTTLRAAATRDNFDGFPSGINLFDKAIAQDLEENAHQTQQFTPTKRKPIPDVIEYVDEPATMDVLLGRGAVTNKHTGNIWFRQMARKLHYEEYVNASKKEKTVIAQILVDTVHMRGGHFLQRQNGSKWFIAHNKTARIKATQALRESAMSEQERRQKRAKYDGPCRCKA